jgi:hypothetical protein
VRSRVTRPIRGRRPAGPLFTSDKSASRNQKLEGEMPSRARSQAPSHRGETPRVPATVPAGASLPLPARELHRRPFPTELLSWLTALPGPYHILRIAAAIGAASCRHRIAPGKQLKQAHELLGRRAEGTSQAHRRLRAHHLLRQRKGVRCASGHRPCPEGQNLLRHAVSRVGAQIE